MNASQLAAQVESRKMVWAEQPRAEEGLPARWHDIIFCYIFLHFWTHFLVFVVKILSVSISDRLCVHHEPIARDIQQPT